MMFVIYVAASIPEIAPWIEAWAEVLASTIIGSNSTDGGGFKTHF